MKKYWSILGIVLFFFTTAPLSQAFAFSASYEQEVTINGNPIANFKVVLQDKNMKASTNLGGQDNLMIRNASGTFNYVPSQNQATKLPDDVRPNITDELPHYMEFLTKNNAQPAGSENHGGYDCDIFTFTDPNTKAPSKVWLWKEKQFPIRIEVSAPEGVTAVEFKNIQVGNAIDGKEFELPADVAVVNYEDLVKKAAEDAEKAGAALQSAADAAAPPEAAAPAQGAPPDASVPAEPAASAGTPQ